MVPLFVPDVAVECLMGDVEDAMSFEPSGDLSGTPLKAYEADGHAQLVVSEVSSTTGVLASGQRDIVGFAG